MQRAWMHSIIRIDIAFAHQNSVSIKFECNYTHTFRMSRLYVFMGFWDRMPRIITYVIVIIFISCVHFVCQIQSEKLAGLIFNRTFAHFLNFQCQLKFFIKILLLCHFNPYLFLGTKVIYFCSSFSVNFSSPFVPSKQMANATECNSMFNVSFYVWEESFIFFQCQCWFLVCVHNTAAFAFYIFWKAPWQSLKSESKQRKTLCFSAIYLILTCIHI